MSFTANPGAGGLNINGQAPAHTGAARNFAINESSNIDGRPVILYEIVRDTVTWRYTSADQDIAFGGNTYAAVPISDQGVSQTGDVESDEFVIQAPYDLEPVSLYVEAPPTDRVRVIVRRHHLGDPDAPIMFAGTLNRVRRSNALSADLICRTLAGVLRKGGLRLTWQRTCPFNLYGPDCKVNKDAFRIGDFVSAINGASITLPAISGQPAGIFTGGFIEWSIQAGVTGRRGIAAHSGSTLTILGGTQGISLNDFVYAFFGCQRTRAFCRDVFNNLPNFGGIAHLPDRSPFDGNPVF